MIIVSVPKGELQDAGRVSGSLNLVDIRLRNTNVFEENIDALFDTQDTTATDVNIEYKAGRKELIEGKTLTALVGATATITKGNAKLVLSAQYHVLYSLPTENIPKELKIEMFDAFAKHNALLNCWPFLRALIGSLSNEVGFPILLPLLKIQTKADEPAKEP